MQTTIHVDPADVRPIIEATFPAYRGAKVQVRAAETVLLTGLNWSGGSRNRYAACTLDGRASGNAGSGNAAPPWRNPVEGAPVAVPAGFVLVQHCMFCGKDLGLRIYVNPSDMPKMLPPAEGNDLSRVEQDLLKLIRSCISSYRREEWTRSGHSLALYEPTVAALKAKGFLTAGGGLSLKGKNAAAGLS